MFADMQKYSFEFISEQFSSKQCVLLEDKYINSAHPMRYKCSCGIEAKITYSEFKVRKLCKGNHTFKISQEQADEYFQEHGCKLLDTYVNIKTPMKYICCCGGQYQITMNEFKQGKRCKKCGIEKSSKTRTTDFQDIKELFEKRQYHLLSTSYTAGDKLVSICPRGHDYTTTLSSFKFGFGCSKCASLNNRGENNPNWNPDREQVELNKTIWNRWRNLLRAGFSNPTRTQNPQTEEKLGYSWKELREHIENHPNWETIKDGKFHIDHIFPIHAFHKLGIRDVKYICALDNLQPITPKQNRQKWHQYDEESFMEYLRSKNMLQLVITDEQKNR
jgi:hypothetical protein